jgi:photosystem II stability/assembly factor-like uncharacterized protein
MEKLRNVNMLNQVSSRRQEAALRWNRRHEDEPFSEHSPGLPGRLSIEAPMRRAFQLSWFPPSLVLLMAVLLVAVPSRGEGLSRDQQIADLERQIQDLTRRLTELRQAEEASKPKPELGLPASWVKTLHWRCIGPAAMGGRIVALSVFEADPTTYWVATASGGLLKTINNGVTFEHQFDRQSTVSIGDVCVAPSDRNIVWVGTGENNPRNSVSYGDGVYKSTDGGKTWTNMGLKKSFQIGRIAIHPKDPNTVYVGALGRLYGPSEERGLYKTTDGGKTWQRVLFVDDKTGVIDIQMHPTEPDTLLVATWERMRDGFDSHRGEPPVADGYDAYDPIKKWGPGSGIWKTSDGGKNFKRLTAGLPSVTMGRIGIDFYRKDPKVVFAIIDTERIGLGIPPSPTFLGIQAEDNPGGGAKLVAVTADAPGGKAGLKVGDIIKAIDKKELKKYLELVQAITAHQPGDKVTLTVLRGKETIEVPVVLGKRPVQEPPVPAFLDFTGENTADGVRITKLPERGPFVRAGLQIGDLVTAVADKKVTTMKELTDLLGQKAGATVTLKVIRGKEAKELTLTTPRQPFRSNRPYSFWYGGQRENVQNQQGPDGPNLGGVYKSVDGGETWARINSVNPRPMYFSQVRVDPLDENWIYVLGIPMYRSTDGGKNFKMEGTENVHPDQHALWINPRDSRHMIIGCDGGFYVSYDRAAKWDYLSTAAIGQFYHVVLDSSRPARAFGGLQDNGSWGGPTRTLNGQGPINEDWFVVSGGDGFVCRVDPTDPDLVYFESQDGNMGRHHLKTGEFRMIRPPPPKNAPPYRFNWNTPFILSSHNPRLDYCGGNHIFRSLNSGDDLRPISPEISRTKRGTASALAESPRDPAVLWAGSDDGFLWITRDGGTTWTNVTDKVGLPGPRWVASIEPSRYVDGRCYVVFDAHRSDDDNPYVFVTEDFGQTWKPLNGNLPWGSTRVLREDIENPDVLYLGTEFAAWASIDRGVVWTKISNNLPTVAVHEFAQHPTTGEMVAATHGRSLWVVDVSALRQTKPATLKAAATLFRPAPTTRWRREPSRGQPYGNGHRYFAGENPPDGAQIYYSLSAKAKKLQLQVFDYAGRLVRNLPVANEPGLHRVTWDLVTEDNSGVFGALTGILPLTGSSVAGPGGPRQRRGPRAAPAGMYRVVLTVDGTAFPQGLRLENDPALKDPERIADDGEEEREKEERKPAKIDD